jgi:hypothetical protein
MRRAEIAPCYKTYKSKTSGEFFVVERTSSADLKVMFIETLNVEKATSSQVRTGEIKDRMRRSVYGVGILGVGEYKPSDNKKASQLWRGMIERCYSERSLRLHPTYIDVIVCDEWHNFQNFAKWFDKNYVHGMHLDKDVLSKSGLKCYSPKTCQFISQADNNRQSAKEILIKKTMLKQ